MKIKNTVIISEAEYNAKLSERYHDGVEDSDEKKAIQIADLKKAVKNRDSQIETLKEDHNDVVVKKDREIERLQAAVDVFEEDREEARELIKANIKNEDQMAALEARKESLDAQAATLKERESKLLDKEDRAQKAAYADGLADGLRKAHEITEKDRENAMKIAMVSAASHTPTETMKELNNVHQLTEGSSNTEG